MKVYRLAVFYIFMLAFVISCGSAGGEVENMHSGVESISQNISSLPDETQQYRDVTIGSSLWSDVDAQASTVNDIAEAKEGTITDVEITLK